MKTTDERAKEAWDATVWEPQRVALEQISASFREYGDERAAQMRQACADAILAYDAGYGDAFTGNYRLDQRAAVALVLGTPLVGETGAQSDGEHG